MSANHDWIEAECDNGCRPIPGTLVCPTCDAPEGWTKRAVCLDQPSEVFFGGAAADRIAVRMCEKCPVRAYCLEKGWDEDYGVWGGLTDGQRIKIRGLMQLDRVTRRQRRSAIRELASRPLNPR